MLTNTDLQSDSGHQSFSLLWETLRAIRRFFLINFKLHIRFCHYGISDASLAYSACMCVSTLWDVGLTSYQAVTGSLFLSSTILLLKLVMNYYLQSFPFILIEKMTVVSYWQNPTPGPFVSIRWEHLGIISLPSSPINSKCGPSRVTIWLAHMSPKTHVRF